MMTDLGLAGWAIRPVAPRSRLAPRVRDLRPVLIPLGALGLDEVAEDVVAERLADDRVLFELVDRVAEGARQLLDPLLRDAAGVHLEEAFFDRLRQLEPPLDPVETGRDHGRESEVGVRRGIGAADLDPRPFDRPTRGDHRYPDERRTVRPAPRQIRRCLVA